MNWSNFIDNFGKVAQIIALGVGSVWVYFNWFRGRTFVPRLQVEASGRVFFSEGIRYLLVTMRVRNAGSSIVHIRNNGTGLNVFPLSAGEEEVTRPASMIEGVTRAFDVLETTLRIEPGTAVHEQKLLVVPTNKSAYKLELMVYAVGGRWLWLELPDRYWRAIAIAAHDKMSQLPDEPHTQKEEVQ